MKGLLSLIVVAIVCIGISGNVNAQDCDNGCDCQPVRNAVVRVLEMPKKVMCEWKSRKPIKTAMCKWRKAKPVRSMFKGCGSCCD
tara:strand:- start:995 stop:1249 length:255 start_codon:yes stop_codon:yes gene_type:complete